MADPLHVLLDNRTAVQLFSDIVGGCSDNLHPALICLGIRFTAYERWKERVVDIDNPVPVMLDERR
ncbi:hypothetical protein D3C87_2129490 [compost metagenome]